MTPENLNVSNCRFTSRISPFHDGEVAAAERQQISAHLQECAICRDELAHLQNLSDRFAEIDAPGITPQALRRMHKAVDTQRDRSLRRVVRAFVAVAASLFIATALWVAQTSSATPESLVPWETHAVDPQSATLANNNPEVAIAQWMVQDLSGSNAHE